MWRLDDSSCSECGVVNIVCSCNRDSDLHHGLFLFCSTDGDINDKTSFSEVVT